MFQHKGYKCPGKPKTAAVRYPAGQLVITERCKTCGAIELLPDAEDEDDGW